MSCSTSYENVVQTEVDAVVTVSTRFVTQPGSVSTVVTPQVEVICPPANNGTTASCSTTTTFVTATETQAGSTETEEVAVTSYQTRLLTSREAVGTSCPVRTTSTVVPPTSEVQTTTSVTSRTTSQTPTSTPARSSTRQSSTSFSTTVIIVTASDGSLSSSASLVPSLVPSNSDITKAGHQTAGIVGGVVGGFAGIVLFLLLGLGFLKGRGPCASLYRRQTDDDDGFDEDMWRPEAFETDEDGKLVAAPVAVVHRQSSSYSVRASTRGYERPASTRDDQLMREHHRRISSSLGHGYSDEMETGQPYATYGQHGYQLQVNTADLGRVSMASSAYSTSPEDYRRASQQAWRMHAPRRSNTMSLLPYMDPNSLAPHRTLQRQSSAPVMQNGRPVSTQRTSYMGMGGYVAPPHSHAPPSLTRNNSASTVSSVGPLTPTLPSPGQWRPMGSKDNFVEMLESLPEEDKRASQSTVRVVDAIQEAQDKLEANATKPGRLFVVNLDEADARRLSYDAKLDAGRDGWLSLMIQSS